ncbi:hypothetical protein [Sorangium sp. So ce381]|uniref:hypothetical protein n=1 Tax=Sorangium sp. So ce381 TaxID=3133307 RepID=UPI003F5B9244
MASLFQEERGEAIGRFSVGFERVEADVNLAIMGANPAISGRPDDSVTLPAVSLTVVKQAA